MPTSSPSSPLGSSRPKPEAPDIESVIVGYAFGIHSNIPECCVLFYITRPSRDVVRLNLRRRAHPPGYVMCPSCWRKFRRGALQPNVVHVCVDSRDHPLCHAYLSGPDRVAGVPIKDRYTREPVPFSIERTA